VQKGERKERFFSPFFFFSSSPQDRTKKKKGPPTLPFLFFFLRVEGGLSLCEEVDEGLFPPPSPPAYQDKMHLSGSMSEDPFPFFSLLPPPFLCGWEMTIMKMRG